jgi:hypothetical protein
MAQFSGSTPALPTAHPGSQTVSFSRPPTSVVAANDEGDATEAELDRTLEEGVPICLGLSPKEWACVWGISWDSS